MLTDDELRTARELATELLVFHEQGHGIPLEMANGRWTGEMLAQVARAVPELLDEVSRLRRDKAALLDCKILVPERGERCLRCHHPAPNPSGCALCNVPKLLDEVERLRDLVDADFRNPPTIDDRAARRVEEALRLSSERERDAARAEVERMRPIVEAALAGIDGDGDMAALVSAVDAYRKGKP